MPGVKRKRPSPPVSENEFDISNALTGNGAFDSSDDADSDLEQAVNAATGKTSSTNNSKNNPVDFNDAPSDSSDGDEAFIAAKQAASNRKSSNLKGRTVKKGGGFQAMGLNAALLKAITRKGFSVPTPIQRKTIPLVLEGSDVVGMARTGSGKTAAFVVPMIEKLKVHSAVVGARAIVMSPSRELALQTLKVVKELGRGTDLRCVLLVGGDSLEEQFSSMTSNPDIIIATPGRFHHLKVEMRLDLSSIQYVVFDEADRLFEMGFAVQLTEILHGLPLSRQTLLFSATLPKSLVEFARAGLQEPKLIRLDAESKVSPDLESAFFLVKSAEKEGALLQIIQDVIKIPTATDAEIHADLELDADKRLKKKRRKPVNAGNTDSPTEYSTMVFAATKHHVEYLTSLLKQAGYAVSYIYGSLDQTARKINVESFREGRSNILIVTDVAARGIDVPVLANVINYDFPSQPKVFVHRVGRTARAGKKGWSYSLVQDSDIPYLVDLQLFLSKRLIVGRNTGGPVNYAEDVVLGTLPRDGLGTNVEWLAKMTDEQADLDSLRSVARKGERLYLKTRNAASTQSVKRAKEIQAMPSLAEISPLFEDEETNGQAGDKEDLLARLRNYRPAETVFEIGKRGNTDETIDLLRKTRSKIDARKAKEANKNAEEVLAVDNTVTDDKIDAFASDDEAADVDMMDAASDDELEVTFSNAGTSKGNGSNNYAESEHFMSYTPRHTNLAEDKAYGVTSGSSSNTRSGGGNFLTQARDAAMDLFNDEGGKSFAEASKPRMRWDKAGRKYVSTANDEDGSKGAKMVRGESGLKIAASLRSGRFDAWKKANGVRRLPQVGEVENTSGGGKSSGNGSVGGKTAPRYKHKSEKAPKEADRFRDDYHVQKKRVAEAKDKRVGKWKDGQGKSEIKSVHDIRKDRQVKERKKLRNGRPSRKGRN